MESIMSIPSGVGAASCGAGKLAPPSSVVGRRKRRRGRADFMTLRRTPPPTSRSAALVGLCAAAILASDGGTTLLPPCSAAAEAEAAHATSLRGAAVVVAPRIHDDDRRIPARRRRRVAGVFDTEAGWPTEGVGRGPSDDVGTRAPPRMELLDPTFSAELWDRSVAREERLAEAGRRDPQGTRRETESEAENPYHLRTNSLAFIVTISTVLGCIGLFRLLLFVIIVRNRRKSSLQIAQPSVLCILVLAGGAAVLSCATLPPLSDLSCRLREPLLLTTISLMETVMVGRVWRIGMLVGPALLRIGDAVREGGRDGLRNEDGRRHHIRAGEGGRNLALRRSVTAAASTLCVSSCKREQWLQRLEPVRQSIMDVLAYLSDWGVFLDCFSQVVPTACCTQGTCGKLRANRKKLRRRREKTSIRQCVSTWRLLWLIFVLMIPQVVLQVCNLTVQSLKVHRYVYVYDEEFMMARYECAHDNGRAWSSVLGVLLAAVPCMLTAFLGLWSAKLPRVLNEAGAVNRSSCIFFLVFAVAGPSLFMTDNPDVRVYLKTILVFSLVLPPCWFIVVGRCWSLFRKEQKQGFHELLRRERQPSERQSENSTDVLVFGSNATGGNSRGGSEVELGNKATDHAKTATLALTIGKMYENMGATAKSVGLFEEALAIWCVDPARKTKPKIGGFTEDEIDSFTSSDLDFIIQLLIAKGRVEGTYNSNRKSGQRHAAQAWVDAMDVYDRAPSSISLSDRSIMFPIFSGLFVFVKGGKISDDDNATFEQRLATQFVLASKLHGDPAHYTRALAMKAEVVGRLGRYREALELFEEIRKLYVPEEHSDTISQAYGTDRTAHAFSQSALWHIQLLEWEEALERCEHVITYLVPRMDPTNTLNMAELLLPVIMILKPRGQAGRMRDLWQDEVVQAFYKHHGQNGKTPCKIAFKPLAMLLDLCDEKRGTRTALFPDLYANIEWVVGEGNGEFPDFLDLVWGKLCWCPSSITAEICLILAEQVTECNPDKRRLIDKGLKLATKANSIARSKLVFANGVNEPLVTRLEKMRDVLFDGNSTRRLQVDNYLIKGDASPRSLEGVDASRAEHGVLKTTQSVATQLQSFVRSPLHNGSDIDLGEHKTLDRRKQLSRGKSDTQLLAPKQRRRSTLEHLVMKSSLKLKDNQEISNSNIEGSISSRNLGKSNRNLIDSLDLATDVNSESDTFHDDDERLDKLDLAMDAEAETVTECNEESAPHSSARRESPPATILQSGKFSQKDGAPLRRIPSTRSITFQDTPIKLGGE